MGITRKDFHLGTRDGFRIAVREVSGDEVDTRVPIILLHGTRIPGLSEFDLPVENGSLAADLARKGHRVYILDARGFGRSERPPEMDAPPKAQARSLFRCIEITRDVEAATDALLDTSGFPKVALLGWGLGGTTAAMFAALQPEKVSHVIGYAMVYGGAGGSPRISRSSIWADPEDPRRFNKERFGNYSWNSLEFLDRHWNDMIPVEDKDEWRDPAMLAAFRQALIDGDPASTTMDPPMYRSPNGMLEDLWTTASRGETLFGASQIYCKVLIARGEYDSLCREEDMEVLIDHLVNAEEVRYFNRTNATQYILLDRPEHGRDALLSEFDSFLR